MKVHINQPQYLPNMNTLQRILSADVYVNLDHVKYSTGTFINRNRWKGPNGNFWMTIPINRWPVKSIARTFPANDLWKEKHRKSMCLDDFLPLSCASDSSISDICMESLNWTCNQLNVKLPFTIRSSELIRSGALDHELSGRYMILEVLKFLKATEYLCGPNTFNYMKEEDFDELGIKITMANEENFKFTDYPIAYYISEERKNESRNQNR